MLIQLRRKKDKVVNPDFDSGIKEDNQTFFVRIPAEMLSRLGEERVRLEAFHLLSIQTLPLIENTSTPLIFYPINKRDSVSWRGEPEIIYSMHWEYATVKEIKFTTLPKYPKAATFWERLVFLFTGKVKEEYKYE